MPAKQDLVVVLGAGASAPGILSTRAVMSAGRDPRPQDRAKAAPETTARMKSVRQRDTAPEMAVRSLVPLRRSHASGANIAADPPDMSGGVSSPVEIVMVHNTYDSFGHVIFASGPNGRCSESVFDPLYGQLTVEAKAFVGDLNPSTGCGMTVLTSSATYDRGLGTPLTATDPTLQPAAFTYDGFGRVIEATFADPANPGTLASEPTMIVSYQLPTDPTATPYTLTNVSNQDGADPNVASYHETLIVSDGLGRTIFQTSERDTAAGDPTGALASGLVEYNTKGEVIRRYKPWFWNLANLPTEYTSTEYDAFGRPVAQYGLDGQLDASIEYHALSEDVSDAADVGPGPRAGTHTTSIGDGHGRGVRRTVRTHVSGNIEQHHTVTRYLPSGEPEKITQQRSGSPDVIRWLRYDSIGRLVLNVEPNTSPDFTTNLAASEASLHAWRYAYNNAGDLVGTTDARGCGSREQRYQDWTVDVGALAGAGGGYMHRAGDTFGTYGLYAPVGVQVAHKCFGALVYPLDVGSYLFGHSPDATAPEATEAFRAGATIFARFSPVVPIILGVGGDYRPELEDAPPAWRATGYLALELPLYMIH